METARTETKESVIVVEKPKRHRRSKAEMEVVKNNF